MNRNHTKDYGLYENKLKRNMKSRILVLILTIFSINLTNAQLIKGIKSNGVEFNEEILSNKVIPLGFTKEEFITWRSNGSVPGSISEFYIVGSGYVAEYHSTDNEYWVTKSYTPGSRKSDLASDIQYWMDIDEGFITDSPKNLEKQLKRLKESSKFFVDESGKKATPTIKKLVLEGKTYKVVSASLPELPEWVLNPGYSGSEDYYTAYTKAGIKVSKSSLVREGKSALMNWSEETRPPRIRYVTGVTEIHTNNASFSSTRTDIDAQYFSKRISGEVYCSEKDIEIFWVELKHSAKDSFIAVFARVKKSKAMMSSGNSVEFEKRIFMRLSDEDKSKFGYRVSKSAYGTDWVMKSMQGSKVIEYYVEHYL